MDKSVEYDPL